MTTRELTAITELIKVAKEVLYRNIYVSDKEVPLMSRLGLAIIEVEDAIDDEFVLSGDNDNAGRVQTQI